MAQLPSESRVRVGVRIRPLTSKEINQGGKNSLAVSSPSVKIAQRQFTFDSVFDSDVGQTELYESVSGPLLKSFTEGYNATVMAYGQTGSGKTFTMGSEAHTQPENSSHVGLIPRFIAEFFHQIRQKKESSDKDISNSPTLLDYNVSASFLEVYGEDVYDLLDADRKSLPLREDSAGGVVIAGLTHRSVSNPNETLQVLHEGTMNRTTAATLMNLTSSRSHAVFTIYLTQVVRSETCDDVDISSTSKFTFVDLAGSERMKKTGAEGERAREGIKINEGLLALGNVINALADEDRIAKEKKIHVPYRQSKLTRLLQDALGGNSQTLFLACVSPSDTNASETLSTLHYANRARNIRNAPTKNVDATALELQRLHTLAHILQCELVKNRFQEKGENNENKENIGHVDSKLMDRTDVGDYIRLIYRTAAEFSQIDKLIPPLSFPSVPTTNDSVALIKPKDSGMIQQTHFLDSTPNKTISERFDDSFLGDVNPDEDMAILDQLLELQHHDHEFDKQRKKDDERLRIVNGELEKEESMLLKIKESLKVYHSLKRKYEELMAEVQQLELEKASLADQLEKAKADPSKGCSAAIKKQLEKVESSLSRARRETRSHRQKYKIADEQAKKCRTLERKINELKQAKRSLAKKQKEDLARYKETTDAKTKELLVLKRKEKTTGKKMSKLESEIHHHKHTLDKRQKYCTKLSEKLKQTESHLLRLLTLRQRDLAKRTSMIGNRQSVGRGNASSSNNIAQAYSDHDERYALTSEEWKSTRFIFNKMVWDKVNQAYLQNLYEERVAVYSDTTRKVMAESKRLSEARMKLKEKKPELVLGSIEELEDSVAELELKLDLLSSELKDIRARMPEETRRSVEDSEEAVSKMMKAMSNTTLRTMLLETLSKLVEAETQRKKLTDSIDRKDAALMSFESEVESLTNQVFSLSKDLTERRSAFESGEDPFDLLKEAKRENCELKEKLDRTESKFQKVSSRVFELDNQLENSKLEHAKTRETLAFLEASLSKKDRMVESTEVLEGLQALWKELGVDVSFREKETQAIQSSLIDTCSRKLNDARVLKADTTIEIQNLTKQLASMRTALGIPSALHDETPESWPLLRKLQKLKHEFKELETPHRYASARRDKIINDAINLSDELGMTSEMLPQNLKKLIELNESQGESIGSDFQVDNSDLISNESSRKHVVEDSLVFLPKSLENGFLSACESDIKFLRVKKSEMLVKSREMEHDISKFLRELHMSVDDLVERIEKILAEKNSEAKEWDKQKAGRILQRLSSSNIDVEDFALDNSYLALIHRSLEEIAKYRHSLTTLLQKIVEHAQKTLLDIVGRELDARQAYASFHDALFRLPALSQDLSLACVSEMEALVVGVEAMTQSETEALTVVWEALNVSSEERRDFWARVETPKSNAAVDNDFLCDFDSCTGTGSEEWITEAVTKAKNVYQELEWKLCKLGELHKEVESLRSKQDTMSQILSLDSELRILNSNLRDFEEQKCNKERLLTKKSSGSKLLKEERFRKQMKSKFVSKLSQLADLLRLWERREGRSFNASLLSDDVQMLLKEPSKMENWVEKRTQCMPLRTVQAQLPSRKRPHHDNTTICRPPPPNPKARSSPYSSQTNSYEKSQKPTKTVLREVKDPHRSNVTKTSRIMPTQKRSSEVLNENLKRDREESFQNISAGKVRRTSRRRENTAVLPFGRVLEDMSTKENPT